tara:strand:+ start:4940 stop:6868 length:1929 start_codon:yes stop_codon:yes gene_type:complete
MSSRADRLLCCAVAYTNAEVQDVPIPVINSSTTIENVIESMMNVLWYEAKQNMSESMTDMPSDPYLHAVDIDTSEPGIVASKNKLDIHRRKLPIPNINYTQRKPMKLYNTFEDLTPDVSNECALGRAEKDLQKKTQKAQRNACKEIKNERASLEKIEKREAAKKKRQDETPEEREERLTEMREKKAQKKALQLEQDDDSKKKKKKETNMEEKSNEENDESISVEKNLQVKDGKEIQNISVNVQEMLEAEASADLNHHSLMPQRIKARNRKTKFHPSPVPFDRHLLALEACWPCQHVKEAFIDIIPDERIKVIQGPPGTGKTTTLIKYLEKYPNNRIFVCAATNVGTANLYKRIVEEGYDCSLLMPQSRIPPGTPVTSQDPSSRIVCSTISGRSGPILDAQQFDVVLVDEAAQCMEAWFWGLIRQEVEHVVMVGDTAQLPALVSEKGQKLGHDRSLMQRIVEARYPYQMLEVQRRMHPEIVSFPNQKFYDNKLQTEYCNAEHFEKLKPYYLFNVKGKCEEVNTSFINEMEAEFCVKKAEMFKQYSDNVIILCPYQAQARQVLSYGANVEVHTVDSFQGREADIVILSIVRTNQSGFWSDSRRLCVALTRAKHVMCIVGNGEEWSGTLEELYKNANDRNAVIHV